MAKTIAQKRTLSAVAFMRKHRDKISKDIASINFGEIKNIFQKGED